nr:hypothetical protein CFP56_25726 [Quercus suber]
MGGMTGTIVMLYVCAPVITLKRCGIEVRSRSDVDDTTSILHTFTSRNRRKPWGPTPGSGSGSLLYCSIGITNRTTVGFDFLQTGGAEQRMLAFDMHIKVLISSSFLAALADDSSGVSATVQDRKYPHTVGGMSPPRMVEWDDVYQSVIYGIFVTVEFRLLLSPNVTCCIEFAHCAPNISGAKRSSYTSPTPVITHHAISPPITDYYAREQKEDGEPRY